MGRHLYALLLSAEKLDHRIIEALRPRGWPRCIKTQYLDRAVRGPRLLVVDEIGYRARRSIVNITHSERLFQPAFDADASDVAGAVQHTNQLDALRVRAVEGNVPLDAVAAHVSRQF